MLSTDVGWRCLDPLTDSNPQTALTDILDGRKQGTRNKNRRFLKNAAPYHWKLRFPIFLVCTFIFSNLCFSGAVCGVLCACCAKLVVCFLAVRSEKLGFPQRRLEAWLYPGVGDISSWQRQMPWQTTLTLDGLVRLRSTHIFDLRRVLFVLPRTYTVCPPYSAKMLQRYSNSRRPRFYPLTDCLPSLQLAYEERISLDASHMLLIVDRYLTPWLTAFLHQNYHIDDNIYLSWPVNYAIIGGRGWHLDWPPLTLKLA